MSSTLDFARGRTVGIMQPYFFPYWGHFSLIAATDCWVVFDITQYTPKSWMNRNRVLHPTTGWQYLSLPMSNSSKSIKICEARIKDRWDAKESMTRKLEHYRKRAPFFDAAVGVLSKAFEKTKSDSLVDLNVSALESICDYLGLALDYRVCSELELELPTHLGAGQWAPEIAGRLHAARYINPEGGRSLFDPNDFERAGVGLSFLSSGSFEYPTRGYEFEPNLSILDAIMWNEPGTILQAIRKNYILNA